MAKTSITFFAFFASIALPCRADQFEGFKTFADPAALKAFTKDVGGLIGGGAFHTGRSLGFPGVDVGIHMTAQSKPSKENTVIKNLAGDRIKTIAVPMAHGEVGLPYLDFILQGVSYQEFALVGGGLRYGLYRSDLVPLIPSVSVSVFTHVLSHNFFTMSHYSANLAMDFSVPFVQPYLGVGVDATSLKVKQADIASLVGTKTKAEGVRGVVGINFKPLPLLYLSGGYSILHGESGFETAFGFKF